MMNDLSNAGARDMEESGDLNVFLNPGSVAIIGANERPGSWGSVILQRLLSRNYAGKVYAVNLQAKSVYGIPAFKDVREIPGPVDLVILAIPEQSVEETISACGLKKVKGITIITAGFGEISDYGIDREKALARLARSFGTRLLGPNVSGTFDLHADFLAAGSRTEGIRATPLAGISQGGFAFNDLLASGLHRGMGVGKFIHTGNECDLTVTDFLEHFGDDPEVKAVLLYIETIRDGRRFIKVARQVTRKKPVVVYKAGRTPGSARAARSHTAALSGTKEIYEGLFDQVGIIVSPTMELLLPLGHALIERPPMRGNRVAVITMGGSWGVVLSDFLEETGLLVPELSMNLQGRLKSMGMPDRASSKNPVDIGAMGRYPDVDRVLSLGREILSSGEVDALILHGIGRPGMFKEKEGTNEALVLEVEKRMITVFNDLEKESGFPVLIGSH
ncbi:MAG: CoA-binding protein, partial [Desulfobacterales bacterium]|nr:CoA-binding protein [Desulfobacterales bacterium]